MRIKIVQDGIELTPETEFEKEALDSIAGRTLKAEYEDPWEGKGALKITHPKHPWDAK